VVVIRHAAERARTTGTVRWAALALERCEVLDHAVRGAPLDLARIPVRGAAVLFPSRGGPVARRRPGLPAADPSPAADPLPATGPVLADGSLPADGSPAYANASPAAGPLHDPRAGIPVPPPDTLVVLDGSWAQARRMLQRIAPLRTMPRLSLPVRDAERLRRPTVAGGMSTLEAIAAALALLGDAEAARGLEALHRLAVSRGLRLRWAPGKAA
jgi:DTW domain-containing protein YfiP